MHANEDFARTSTRLVERSSSTSYISSTLGSELGGFPALQKLLLQSAVLQYWRILSQIEAAVRSEDHVEVMPVGLNAAGAALKSVFSDDSLNEAVWLTHRLLWALPWAARHVPPSAAAARALGQIFDSTVLSRHAVRPMADAWVGWSVKWTRRFGEEWALQLPTGEAASRSQAADAPDSEPLAPAP